MATATLQRMTRSHSQALHDNNPLTVLAKAAAAATPIGSALIQAFPGGRYKVNANGDLMFDATNMCKEASKKTGKRKDMHNYLGLASTKEFLKELKKKKQDTEGNMEGNMENSRYSRSCNGQNSRYSKSPHGLIQVIQGGQPAEQGTWVHYRVATHLSQWLSAEFAVLVNDLIIAFLSGQLTTEASQEASQQVAQEFPQPGPSRVNRRQRSQTEVPEDPLRDNKWYGTRELRSKPFHIQRSEKMKETFPGLTQRDYCQWNRKVGEAVTGLAPKEFSEKTGAPKKNRRDYYNTWGLATQTWLDSTAIGFMESGKMENFEDYKKQFNEIADMVKNLGEKNKLFDHLEEKPTRPILTAREALAANNAIENPAQRRVTDRIYH